MEEINSRLKQLKENMVKYDKNMVQPRTKDFNREFFDPNEPSCMPLSQEETRIYRILTGVLPEEDIEDLAREKGIDVKTFKKRVEIIDGVLLHYFGNVNAPEEKYNASVNDSNKDVTIFVLRVSYTTLYTLRLMNCYYLKDISKKNLDELATLINERDFKAIINAMEEYGIRFDFVYKL